MFWHDIAVVFADRTCSLKSAVATEIYGLVKVSNRVSVHLGHNDMSRLVASYVAYLEDGIIAITIP